MEHLLIKLTKPGTILHEELVKYEEFLELDYDSVSELMETGRLKDRTLSLELYEVCDRVHSGCNNDCPVYLLNGSKIPYAKDDENCKCFKNGSKMLEFIRYNTK